MTRIARGSSAPNAASPVGDSPDSSEKATRKITEIEPQQTALKTCFILRVGAAPPPPLVLSETGCKRVEEVFGGSDRLDSSPKPIMQARGQGEDAGCIGISSYAIGRLVTANFTGSADRPVGSVVHSESLRISLVR